MTEYEHLQVCDLLLTVRSPLYVGSGKLCRKSEYIYDPRTGDVLMPDQNKLFTFLAENGLADRFESYIFSGKTNLYSFLKDCGLSSVEISALCLYRVSAADTLDGVHSLDDIHTFIRDAANRVYVPGSSIKGALRTVILHALMGTEKKGRWPDEPREIKKARQMQTLEGEYLNTLNLKKDKYGQRVNDAVNSILRGIMVSDSEPISDKCIMLAGKTDVMPEGTMRDLPLCRECIRPGTVIRCELTLDRSVLGDGMDSQWIVDAIRQFDSDYKNTFLSRFRTPYEAEKLSLDCCLILGGGSGFFPKALPYRYLGFDDGLHYTVGEMLSQFRNHKHDRDETEHGISPHTMKYCRFRGRLFPYGICEVTIR